jgi:hypothetical protein
MQKVALAPAGFGRSPPIVSSSMLDLLPSVALLGKEQYIRQRHVDSVFDEKERLCSDFVEEGLELGKAEESA